MAWKLPTSVPLSNPNLAATRMASQFTLNPAIEEGRLLHKWSGQEYTGDELTDGRVHDLGNGEVDPIARKVPVVGEAVKDGIDVRLVDEGRAGGQ
jgi:hypothetical protein